MNAVTAGGMGMKSFRWLGWWPALLVAAAVIAAGTPGCALLIGGAVGAGAVAYAKGDVRETVPEPLDRVTAAARKALADRKLAVKKTVTTADRVTYEAGVDNAAVSTIDAAKQRVSVHCVSLAPASTEITIRAGTIGDEERGRAILNEIKAALK